MHDIGQDLGCGSHVSALERIAVGNISLNDCYNLENLEQDFKNGKLKVLDAAEILGFPIVEADEKMMKRVKNGNSLRNNSE